MYHYIHLIDLHVSDFSLGGQGTQCACAGGGGQLRQPERANRVLG